MEKQQKLTKRNIKDFYEGKMQTALCYVERTKDTESFYSNGVTVYVNSQWAVVSRMYIRTVYSNETSNYALLRLILDLHKQKLSNAEMTKEEEDALQNGMLWVQSLVISDSYSDFELSMEHLTSYLEFFEKKMAEAESKPVVESDKQILTEMSEDEMIKNQLKENK